MCESRFHRIKTLYSLQELLQRVLPRDSFLLNSGEEDYILGSGILDEFIYSQNVKGSFASQFDDFLARTDGKYRFGFLSYDLKNEFEPELRSKNPDKQLFPLAHFVVAENVYIWKNGEAWYFGKTPDKILDLPESVDPEIISQCHINAELPEADYLERIARVKEYIQQGNAYELNYCTSFSSEVKILSVTQLYAALLKKTNAPFSALLQTKSHFVFCASPERFVNRSGNVLTCQPIKGTLRRGRTEQEDKELAASLSSNAKELAENIMIVDLVRNDLSKVSIPGSVKVSQLNQLRTFQTVHQLISTIRSELIRGVSVSEIFRALFPMGSMTGAPKISVMKICEELETFRRGLYSGAIGIIQPNGDFDFNVVIRTILYNREKNQLSIPVGGAITMKSDPQSEYNECLTKLEALKNVVENN